MPRMPGFNLIQSFRDKGERRHVRPAPTIPILKQWPGYYVDLVMRRVLQTEQDRGLAYHQDERFAPPEEACPDRISLGFPCNPVHSRCERCYHLASHGAWPNIFLDKPAIDVAT